MIEVGFVPNYAILSEFDSQKYQQKLALAKNSPTLMCGHMILQKVQAICRTAPNLFDTHQKTFIYSRCKHLAP